MSKFRYLARSADGKAVQGEIEATSITEVNTKLSFQKLTPVRVVQVGGAKAGIKKGAGSITLFEQRVKSKDLQIFTRQFSTLINAGIPVVDSMKILGQGLGQGVLKDAVLNVKTSIENGRRLGEAMANSPAVFDRLYVNMVMAGEEAGILDGILVRLANYMEKSEKIKNQVKGALSYPIIIIGVASLVIGGILIFIIPKFTEFFSSMGKEPPALTMFVVGISNSLRNFWYIYIAVAAGVPFAIKAYIRTPEGQTAFETFIFKAPIFGPVVQKSSIAKMTRTLSTLLSSGVGLVEAIEIAAKTSGNVVVERALINCKTAVMSGRPFTSPLAKEKIFPEMVVQMIGIGEQSGSMDIMLGKIADFYEDDVEVAVKTMTSMLEPLLMVVLGGIIAFLVIAMYLPIFSIGDAIGG